MEKLFTRRRVQASFAGSAVLHAILFAGWPRPVAPPVERSGSTPIFLEVVRAPEPVRRIVAMAGERPSGRGHALAGSNPSKAGTPRHARHTQTGRGHAAGAGTAGAAPAGAVDPVPVPEAVTDERSPPPDAPPAAAAPPSVAADDLFDRLAREQRMRLAKGNGGGLAGFGDGNGGVGLGLGSELSGREVVGSHVASPPVAIHAGPVECVFASSLRLSALVRVLVTRGGEAAVPRLALSSGEGAFDACALKYVLGMRFSPGMDAAGHPLDVWMNVRVTPAGG